MGLVIPAIIFAVGSYFFYAKLGLIETRVALILSHTVIAMPVALINITGALQGVDRTLELAARTLGANSVQAFFRITLPLIRPGLWSAGILCFIISFDEPVIALFLAGTRTVTLPKRMWDGIRYEIDPSVAAISTLIICGTAILIALSRVGDKRVRDQ